MRSRAQLVWACILMALQLPVTTAKGKLPADFEFMHSPCAPTVLHDSWGTEQFEKDIVGRLIKQITVDIAGSSAKSPFQEHISALTVTFDDNAVVQNGVPDKKFPNPRRKSFSLNVDEGEYLSDITLHCGVPDPRPETGPGFQAGLKRVIGLQMTTSAGRAFEMGRFGNEQHFIKSFGKRISSFHGKSGADGIETFGVYFEAVDFGQWPKKRPDRAALFAANSIFTKGSPDHRSEERSIKCDPYGNLASKTRWFDDFDWIVKQRDHKRLARVLGKCGDRVNQLWFDFRNNRDWHSPITIGEHHGGWGGFSVDHFELARNEFITVVKMGKAYHGRVMLPWPLPDKKATPRLAYIELWTNYNRKWTCGKMPLLTTTISREGYAVAGFWGHTDHEVDQLGFTSIPIRDF